MKLSDEDEEEATNDTILQAVSASGGGGNITDNVSDNKKAAKEKDASVTVAAAVPLQVIGKSGLLQDIENAQMLTSSATTTPSATSNNEETTPGAPPPPTDALSRSTAVRPNPVTGTPGAFYVGPAESQQGENPGPVDLEAAESETVDPSEFAVAAAPPNGSRDAPNHDNSDLAVANEVEDPGEPLASGRYVDPQEELARIEKREEIRRRERYHLFGCGAFVIVALALVLVIPLVLIDQGNENTTIRGVASNGTSSTEDEFDRRPYLESLVLPLLPNTTLASIKTSSSNQRKALNWIVEDPNLESYPEWRIVQRFALATFFFATGGALPEAASNMTSGWKTDTDWLSYHVHECDWFQKNDTGDFAAFFPPENNSLTFVNRGRPCVGWYNNQQIDGLENNDAINWDGTMDATWNESYTFGNKTYWPPNHVDFRNKTLWIGQQGLHIGTMQDLWLWSNNLQTEQLPEELYLLTSLRTLALQFNSLEGTLSTHIGKMTDLYIIDFAVQRAGLSGTLPTELGLMSSIYAMYLLVNKFEGTIPSQYGALSTLQRLQVDSNLLTGTIPTELGNMEKMWFLYLFNNALTGTIPTELGRLTTARELNLASTGLEGTVPSEIGLMTELQRLWFYDANLTGTIPEELANLRKLTTLSTSDNQFTGIVPSFFYKIWKRTSTILPDH